MVPIDGEGRPISKFPNTVKGVTEARIVGAAPAPPASSALRRRRTTVVGCSAIHLDPVAVGWLETASVAAGEPQPSTGRTHVNQKGVPPQLYLSDRKTELFEHRQHRTTAERMMTMTPALKIQVRVVQAKHDVNNPLDLPKPRDRHSH